MSNNYLVILAGGVGSRFWPISNEHYPKQFLDLLNCGRTMLQLTADRFDGVVPKENIWVMTSVDYAEIVRNQLPEIPKENVIAEPCQRGTAACVCYISWKIKKLNPKANIVVTPSDHIVPDTAKFQEAVKDTLSFAEETDAILTLGLKPTLPEPGYGYIKADLSYSSSRKHNIYRVDKFKEKPSVAEAEEYVKLPNYFWNSGVFIWSVATVINAFRVYESEISEIFENLLPVYGTPDEAEAIERAFPMCKTTSLDYAIMEKAEEIFVYPASFPWSDLNSWNTLHSQSSADAYGNAVFGEGVRLYDTYNSVVHAVGARHVIVQGLDGFIVAIKQDEVLICKLSEEERIKLFRA